MYNKRCPWCGKIINRYLDQQLVKKEKTPLNLRYAKCNWCHNYYGQNINSIKNKKYILGACIFLLLGIVLECFYISILSIFLLLVLSQSPIVKMDEKENEIVSNCPKYDVQVLIKSHKIKSHEYYFFNSDFDKYESFLCVSPLYIHSLCKTGKRAIVSFLYAHEQNNEYINKEFVILYDSHMKEVAKIKFVKEN